MNLNNSKDEFDTIPVSPEEARIMGQVKGVPVESGELQDTPSYFGRYRVTRLLGAGGSGRVYHAVDEQLKRYVAVKVTKGQRWSASAQKEMYSEARLLAELDHPHIVPVFDVGQTENKEIYVVSKMVQGMDLSSRLKQSRVEHTEAIKIVIEIADALGYIHSKGLIHRDVKPSNILMDSSGRTYLADFGIALRESDVESSGELVGTPRYMSPEQARGEGHRIDNRSDIYSLGVVLYEMLAGRPPFLATSFEEMMTLLTNEEVKSPRVFDKTIPLGLERICLKTLARKSSERYSNVNEFVVDLRAILAEGSISIGASPIEKQTTDLGITVGGNVTKQHSYRPEMREVNSTVASQSIQIVPKGLRSFDEKDASFFLALLPGPYDRDGLPDAIQFWKTRIEQKNLDKTFIVGVIYGPSGCGKSSLVKAGLLPRLQSDIVPIYLEATAEDTESRLLRAVRIAIPEAQGESLKEVLASIRRRKLVPTSGKLLIVIDQFEQWLFSKRDLAKSELIDALRECNGVEIQALVMVRDDFWISVSRFLGELEIPLIEKVNISMVDLFTLEHACKVLRLFGAAYDKLPTYPQELSDDQQLFIRQAVDGIAQEGRVNSVRIAILSEMLRFKPWSAQTLINLGGIQGVGIAFLDEIFGEKHSRLQYRNHHNAIRGLLAALLPASGVDIKGSKRNIAELQIASGYESQPRELADLLRILDEQLRLITPVDAGEKNWEKGSKREISSKVVLPSQNEVLPSSQNSYYQLTHDYLVPVLREWLTRKQKETRRGRAELKLAERTDAWLAKKELKQLPSLGEWVRIRCLTERVRWKPTERSLMEAAGRLHLSRIALISGVAGLFMFVAVAVSWSLDARRFDQMANNQIAALRSAEFSRVPDELAKLEAFRPSIDVKLQSAISQLELDSPDRLKLSLGLLGRDPQQLEYLAERLPYAKAEQVPVLVKRLAPFKNQILPLLWQRAQEKDPLTILPVASALAAFDPKSGKWQEFTVEVSRQLTKENSLRVPIWIEELRPNAEQLKLPLAQLYFDRNQSAQVRNNAGVALRAYLASDPKKIFELLERVPPPTSSGNPLEWHADWLAIRRSDAGVFLLSLGETALVRPILQNKSNPQIRSHLIHAIAPAGIAPQSLVEFFEVEADVVVRRALLLSLGEYPPERLEPTQRDMLVEGLKKGYVDEKDPGMHGAIEWLLRKWGHEKWLKEAKQNLQQQAFLSQRFSSDGNEPEWYVNSQGQTFAVLPKAVFQMGRDSEFNDGPPHNRMIDRHFAISTKEVTFADWRKFHEAKISEEELAKRFGPKFADEEVFPVMSVTWYAAAEYCNWLSEIEGIPKEQWCYEPNDEGNYFRGMKVKRNFWELEGYRLPTEAEWEYACRAGSQSAFSFGDTDSLLDHYAWFFSNTNYGKQRFPIGVKKPNEFGIFDMHGSAAEWCTEEYDRYPDGELVKDHPMENGMPIEMQSRRVVRGGAFDEYSEEAISSNRNYNTFGALSSNNGFRLAKTCVPLGKARDNSR